MDIFDLTCRTGLTRANVRFYEAEGLLPARPAANGRRCYDDADVQTLLHIRLLRQMGVGLPDIRRLLAGEVTLDAFLSRRLEQLDPTGQSLSPTLVACRCIHDAQTDLAQLDANAYLPLLRANESVPLSDRACAPAHPWRRFFARNLDILLYGLLFSFFCFVVLHLYPTGSTGFDLLSLVCTVALTALLEPLLLHLFGTTPGKWIFGITVTDCDGKKLSYGAAFSRWILVFRRGIGYYIPIYNLYRLYRSYCDCQNQALEWDHECTYAIRDSRTWRCVAMAAAVASLLFLEVVVALTPQLAPNRGQLTQEEFVENYNYYASGLLGEYASLMSDSLTLQAPGDGYSQTFAVELDADGFVSQVTYRLRATDAQHDEFWFTTDQTELLFAALALTGAQPEATVFTLVQNKTIQALDTQLRHDYEMELYGVTISHTVRSEGLRHSVSDGMLSPEDVPTFSVEQETVLTVS